MVERKWDVAARCSRLGPPQQLDPRDRAREDLRKFSPLGGADTGCRYGYQRALRELFLAGPHTTIPALQTSKASLNANKRKKPKTGFSGGEKLLEAPWTPAKFLFTKSINSTNNEEYK